MAGQSGTPEAPRNLVIINLGTATDYSPLNFLRNAQKALRQGIASCDVEGGVYKAIALILLASLTAQDAGEWGHPASAIAGAFSQIRQICLEIVAVTHGSSAEVIRAIIKNCDESLGILDFGDAR